MSMERNIIENSTGNQDLIVLPETKTTSNTQVAITEPIKEVAGDKLQETIMKLGEIFPDAVKDGEVDFEKLKKVVDKKEEVLPVILQRKDSVNAPLKDDKEQKVLTERERNAERRHRRRLEHEAQRRTTYEERLEREAQEAEEYARQQERRKIFAAIGAVIVTLILIYFFGLLGPAIFGLLAGGLLSDGKWR